MEFYEYLGWGEGVHASSVDLSATHFDEFHTYGLLWGPQERMLWSVDGKPVFEIKQSAISIVSCHTFLGTGFSG